LFYFHPREELPTFEATELFEKGMAVSAALLESPPDEVQVEGALLSKLPGSGPTTWHQDDAFAPPDQIQCNIGVWLALDDAHVENGCLRIIPGSQEGPLRRHPSLGRAELRADEANPVSVPIPAGGAVVFNGRVLHGSHPNDTTHRERRAMSIVF